MYKYFFLLLSLTKGISANLEEKTLIDYLLTNHNPDVRPILNYDEPVEVQLGLAVQTIESFDQMEETITLNIWQRMNWVDETLNWDSSISNLTVITLDPSDIWTPDLELLNAATKPIIYTLEGGLYLNNDGTVIHSKPTILKFSCPLKLSKFPFDTQTCTMNMSSWVYTNDLLELIPNEDITKQIDMMDSFRHSEWEVLDAGVLEFEEERDCCIDKDFNVISYSFTLQRFTHYYKISMGMTITLVIVSFIIMLMPPDNVSRTGTAVFIPLTILALQLTLADKIPIVGYYTLMDYFFLLCFVTSMLVSIESGLIYSLLTSNSPKFYDWLEKQFDVLKKHKLEKESDDNNDNPDDNNDNPDDFVKVIDELNGVSETSTDDTRSLDENNNRIIDILSVRSNSYHSGMNNNGNNNSNSEIRRRTPGQVEDNVSEKKSIRDEYLEENNIQKVINYDDKMLYLSQDHVLIDNILNRYIRKFDNYIRIILPTIFFVLIIVIMSYEN